MPSQSYFAVFDGHVGVEAAVYASIHVLTNVVRHPSFENDLVTAIKEGIHKTDDGFCKKVQECIVWEESNDRFLRSSFPYQFRVQIIVLLGEESYHFTALFS